MATAVKTRRQAGSVSKAVLDEYSIHEAANMFPLIDDDNLHALAEDIRMRGQQEPIWMYQGQLLDGRNRVLACALVGKEPIRQEWKPKAGDTPVTFVMSRNLHRRHLTASQRAALAVELEAVIAAENKAQKAKNKTTTVTDDPFSNATKPTIALSTTPNAPVEFSEGDPAQRARVGEKVRTGRVREQAASTMQVSSGYVNDAKDLRKAAPEKFDRVKSGQLSIQRAQDEVVREAQDSGSLSDVKLRPGAVKAAMERLEAQNRPKREEKTEPIRLPKATKVQSSATTLSITVTFGNRGVAEDWLNRMQEDKKVLDLNYEVVEKQPARRKRKTAV